MPFSIGTTYEVTVFPTDDSRRCGLSDEGFLLFVATKDIRLINKMTKKTKLKWPYAYIKSYFYHPTKFSFEAGRLCESGQGIFSFCTANASRLLDEVRYRCKILSTQFNDVRQITVSYASTAAASVELPETRNTEEPCTNNNNGSDIAEFHIALHLGLTDNERTTVAMTRVKRRNAQRKHEKLTKCEYIQVQQDKGLNSVPKCHQTSMYTDMQLSDGQGGTDTSSRKVPAPCIGQKNNTDHCAALQCLQIIENHSGVDTQRDAIPTPDSLQRCRIEHGRDNAFYSNEIARSSAWREFGRGESFVHIENNRVLEMAARDLASERALAEPR